MNHQRFLFFFYMLFVLGLGGWDGAMAATVTLTPEGKVDLLEQVQLTFDQAMVPVGDLSAVTLQPAMWECSPAVTVKPRWISQKIWTLNFSEKAPPNTKCAVTLKKDLKDLKGKSFIGKKSWTIETDPLTLLRVRNVYDSVETDQIFVLEFNHSILPETIENNIYLLQSGRVETIPLQVLKDSEQKKVFEILGYDQTENPGTLWAVKPQLNFGPESEIKFHSPRFLREDLKFSVEKDFHIVTMCTRSEKNALCSPLDDITLQFSSFVEASKAQSVKLKSQKGKVLNGELSSSDKEITSLKFKGPYEPGEIYEVIVPQGFKDLRNRTLLPAHIPKNIKIGEWAPLAKFASRMGLLESQSGPALFPLTVRGVGDSQNNRSQLKVRSLRFGAEDFPEVLKFLSLVGDDNHRQSLVKKVQGKLEELVLPLKDFQHEMVGIPLKSSGVFLLEVESPALAKYYLTAENLPLFYTQALVNVTNMGLHMKVAEKEALLWVTSLKHGTPIVGAKVIIGNCARQKLLEGETNTLGYVSGPWKKQTPRFCHSKYKNESFWHETWAIATTQNDFSFVLASWNNGIDSWRFDLPWRAGEKEIYHTLTDRPVYKPGEVVHLLHLLKEWKDNALQPIKESVTKIEMVHWATQDVFPVPSKELLGGRLEGTWKIPPTAKTGSYDIRLTFGSGKNQKEKIAGSVLVSDFKIPYLLPDIIKEKPFAIAGENFPLRFSLQYGAGGAVPQAVIRWSGEVRSSRFKTNSELHSYNFSNGGVFATSGPTRNESLAEQESLLKGAEVKLSQNGVAQIPFSRPKRKDGAVEEVMLDMQYKDANGEFRSKKKWFSVLPAEKLVGIKADSYVTKKKDLKVWVMAITPLQKPLAHEKVRVTAFKHTGYSSRVRLFGGLYSYDSFYEVTPIPSASCEVVTDQTGQGSCLLQNLPESSLQIMAELKDQKGRSSLAHTTSYGRGYDWSPPSDNDRIDLITDKAAYEAGDKAQVKIDSPFQNALMLWTIERDGLLETHVQKWSNQFPTLQVPLSRSLVPNAYLSVVQVRPRIDSPPPDFSVDLGKPGFKLGIKELIVRPTKSLVQVQVQTPHHTFKPRGKVPVKIRAISPDGGFVPPGSKVTVTAYDRALLQIAEHSSWDLLRHFFESRPLEVENSTNQIQLVGKRHFGLKTREVGGGGGKAGLRELFDAGIFWKTDLLVNSQGEVQVEIPLNDNLTTFVVKAFVETPKGQMGVGEGQIVSTQDLLVFPQVPKVLRPLDQIPFALSLKNNTSQVIKQKASLVIDGFPQKFNPISFEMKPGGSTELKWPLQIPAQEGKFRARVKIEGALQDELSVPFTVEGFKKSMVFSNELIRLEKAFKLNVTPPASDIRASQLTVQGMSSLGALPESVKKAAREYPYSCLEQRMYQALVLEDQEIRAQILASLDDYLTTDGLLTFYPTDKNASHGSSSLTSHFLMVAKYLRWPLSDRHKKVMLEGLKKTLARKKNWKEGQTWESAIPLVHYGYWKWEDLSQTPLNVKSYDLAHASYGLELLEPLKDQRAVKLRNELKNRFLSQLVWSGTEVRARENFNFTPSFLESVDSFVSRGMLSLSRDVNNIELLTRYLQTTTADLKQRAFGNTYISSKTFLVYDAFKKQFEKSKVTGVSQVSFDKVQEKWDWQKALPLSSLPWKNAGELTMQHLGSGKPWALVQTAGEKSYPKGQQDLSVTLSSHISGAAQALKVGDRLRIILTVKSQRRQSMTALTDYLPAGGQVVATKGDSLFVEKRLDRVVFYLDELPEGVSTFEYELLLQTPGSLQRPGAYLEVMYHPEVWAKAADETWEIRP